MTVAEALYERLEFDGMNVVQPDLGILEIDSNEAKEGPRTLERKSVVREAVEEADVVIFCLSKEFNRLSEFGSEWQFVLDVAANKKQGNISIVPIRLEDCPVPQKMKRWSTIDLQSRDGYEKLMLAMKLRADKFQAELIPDESWRESFYEDVPVAEEVGLGGRLSMTWIIALLVIVGVAAIFLASGTGKRSMEETASPADILAENATQRVQSEATDRAAAATSIAITQYGPLTQTAVYLTTTEPLAMTATAVQAQITPTITLTSVSLPTQIVVSNNVSMLLVPGGRYRIGFDGDPETAPAITINIDPYYIDQYEVTNAQYHNCVSAGVCQPPRENGSQTHLQYYDVDAFADFPVINVDWEMARLYCEWRGARLPTEAEWEAAARGPDSLNQPWGEGTGCLYANHDNCIGDTQPVTRYLIGISEFNLYNMAGNISEWVGSLYLPYPYNPFDERDNPASSGPRVVRGGSWASSPDEIYTYQRISLDPSSYSIYGNDLGFRCARGADQ